MLCVMKQFINNAELLVQVLGTASFISLDIWYKG